MSDITNMNIKSVKSTAHPCMKNKNQKTRMCKNALRCVFGDRCHYAHKISELKIANCAFGDECIFVNRVDGYYINKKDIKMCWFRHADETDVNYNVRIGNVSVVDTPPKKHPINTPPPNVKQEVKSLLKPIQLNFDDGNWVTVRSKPKNTNQNRLAMVPHNNEIQFVTVNEDSVFEVLSGLMERNVTRVNLTITY
jgi:hypothetical protein